MKDKIQKNTRLGIGAGIHSCEIIDGFYDSKNKCVHITIKEETSGKTQKLFFDLPRLGFLLKKFCRSCGFDLKTAPVVIRSKFHKNHLIGKKFWLCVRLYQEISSEGEILVEHYEPFNFMQKLTDVKPSVMGDPEKYGQPCGDFYKIIKHREKGYPETLQVMPRPKQLDNG